MASNNCLDVLLLVLHVCLRGMMKHEDPKHFGTADSDPLFPPSMEAVDTMRAAYTNDILRRRGSEASSLIMLFQTNASIFGSRFCL